MVAVIGILLLLLMLGLGVFYIACGWIIFSKAGKPGWASLIPIYNTIVMLDIAGKPWWWFFLLMIPVVGLILAIMVVIDFAKAFGKGTGFAIGLILPPTALVFVPILAFGSAEYLGPGGSGPPRGRKKLRRDEEGYEDDYEDEDEHDRPRKKLAARDDDFDDDDDRPRKKLPAPDDDFEDEPRPTAIKTPPKPPPLPVAKSAPAADASIVQCTSCGRKLKIPATAVGKKVKCPGCGTAFVA